MEDDKGERKTKTISYTVYEDDYDAQVEAVLEALINSELERGIKTRTGAVTEALVNAILDKGELRFGEERAFQIMEEGSRKRREENELHADQPEPFEP